jgi:hypothetical protein
MMWRIRGWCRDCCGEDFQGCFDGSTIVLDGRYASKELAEDAAIAWVDRSPYEFELFEEPDE